MEKTMNDGQSKRMVPKYWMACLMAALFLFSAGWAGAEDFRRAMEEADACLDDGRYLEALGAYRDIAERAPDPERRAKAILRVGDIYGFFLNDHDRALRQYAMLKERYGGTLHAPQAYFNTGMVLYEKDRYREAFEQFKIYTEKFPNEARRDAAVFMMETCAKGPPADEKRKAAIKLAAGQTIRVLLVTGLREALIEAPSPFEIRDLKESRVLAQTKTFRIDAAGGGTEPNGWLSAPEGMIVAPAGADTLTLNGAPYRGKLRIQRNPKGGLDIVNLVPLEAYLYGVVPREMPSQWFPEALKAQAIAARTYVLYQVDKSRTREYDVLPTTASQVYGGAAAETENSNRAVDETKGAVLLYNNQLALAYFHANSGGTTEDAEQVWAAEVPYLKAIRDDYSLQAPGCTWKRTLDLEEIRQALNRNKMEIGAIDRMKAEDFSPSGRIVKIRILHAGKETVMNGNDFRLKTDPVLIRSTFFTVTQNGREITLEGKGYGHGVGMSQWGAYMMAKEGRSCRDILQFYYPGVEIRTP